MGKICEKSQTEIIPELSKPELVACAIPVPSSRVGLAGALRKILTIKKNIISPVAILSRAGTGRRGIQQALKQPTDPGCFFIPNESLLKACAGHATE
jgi:hypothetical protein